VLPQCPVLSLLTLGGTDIVDQAVLAQCPALSELYLNDNQIGDPGEERFAGVLPQCPALSQLGLDGNQIGDQGAGSWLTSISAYNGKTLSTACSMGGLGLQTRIAKGMCLQ
jgi:hypothetical protein